MEYKGYRIEEAKNAQQGYDTIDFSARKVFDYGASDYVSGKTLDRLKEAIDSRTLRDVIADHYRFLRWIDPSQVDGKLPPELNMDILESEGQWRAGSIEFAIAKLRTWHRDGRISTDDRLRMDSLINHLQKCREM